ncbi:hypothetical protein HK096_005482, partial [Nowakowskiella sp. JEL0078]
MNPHSMENKITRPKQLAMNYGVRRTSSDDQLRSHTAAARLLPPSYPIVRHKSFNDDREKMMHSHHESGSSSSSSLK